MGTQYIINYRKHKREESGNGEIVQAKLVAEGNNENNNCRLTVYTSKINIFRGKKKTNF